MIKFFFITIIPVDRLIDNYFQVVGQRLGRFIQLLIIGLINQFFTPRDLNGLDVKLEDGFRITARFRTDFFFFAD